MGLTQHQPTPARRHFMMTSPRAQAAFHHQQFFFEQKDKLAYLLNTISAHARNATTITNPSLASSTTTMSSDYHELLTVTTNLLSEAQTLSTWTFDMIESSGPQVEPFAEKVGLVERVAGELRERVLQQQQQMQQMQHTINAATTTTSNTAGPRSCTTTLSASSKKRSRSGEDDGEEEGQQQQQQYRQSNTLSCKRSRVFHHPQQQQQQPQQHQEIMSGMEPTTTSSCGTQADRFFLQTPWWTQRPICD